MWVKCAALYDLCRWDRKYRMLYRWNAYNVERLLQEQLKVCNINSPIYVYFLVKGVEKIWSCERKVNIFQTWYIYSKLGFLIWNNGFSKKTIFKWKINFLKLLKEIPRSFFSFFVKKLIIFSLYFKSPLGKTLKRF